MRDDSLIEPPPEPPDPPEPPPGRIRPASPAVLTVFAVAGLVGGWLLRPVAEAAGSAAPVVTWVQPIGLALVALILGLAAWYTWRTLHVRHEPMDPRGALNRLALARASAYVGALVAGGYAGYAVSWLGLSSELADHRAWRSGFAALAAVAVVTTALLLERACRVRSDGEEP